MWDRKELKANAKAALKANYWMAVLAAIVMAIALGGSTASTGGNFSSSNDEISEAITSAMMDEETAAVIIAVVLVILGIIGIALIIGLLLKVLLWNPVQVGCQKFFIGCKDQNPPIGTIGFAFKNGYKNIIITMFFKDLFISLWSLLFVIPGIIKAYEYMMIPYLMADNPDMEWKEAFAKSKEMMTGNKWNAFVLDLSFIGWHILTACTCGIAGVFYTNPYLFLTKAELYHALKK